MHVNPVEAAVFQAEVLVQIGAEHAPGHPTAFRRQVAERAIEHPSAPDAVGAVSDGLRFVGAVFLPRHGSDVFQGHVIDAVERIDSAARVQGGVSPAFLQARPLLANDRPAALDGDPHLEVSTRLAVRRIARETQPAALDHQVVVVAGRRGDKGEVLELPGNVTDDAALFLHVKQFFAGPTPLGIVGSGPNADPVVLVADGDQVSRIWGQFGDDLHARLEFLQERGFGGLIQGDGLRRPVIENHETRVSPAVVAFVDVEHRLAPVDVRGDGDAVGLLDPEFAAGIDDRNLVLIGVFVRHLDVHAIIVLTVADGAEHPVIDGLVFQQHG